MTMSLFPTPILLIKFVFAGWVAARTNLEGPLDVILRLLQAIREILDVIRSL
jgi:hypothetical protein